MNDFVRWNITRSGRRQLSDDIFFVSCPKSGRTWIRVFYGAYLARLTGAEFALVGIRPPQHPSVVFTHDRWDHQRLPGFWNFIRGKHLILPRARREKKIVLLARDPRDVVVSNYFHLTRRPLTFRWRPQPLPEMLRSADFGMAAVVTVMNGWLAEWQGRPNFKLLRFEDCHRDAAREFRGLLEFFGLAPLDAAAFSAALEFSRFENMHALEAAGKFRESELTPGNPADPESFKVRRGKVGGFRDYFDAADLAYAALELKKLDPRFGYPVA
jgi:hypothetical protein